jgi:hypothetical protein
MGVALHYTRCAIMFQRPLSAAASALLFACSATEAPRELSDHDAGGLEADDASARAEEALDERTDGGGAPLAPDATTSIDASLNSDVTAWDAREDGRPDAQRDATNDSGPRGVELNPAWIGGACGAPSDCQPDGSTCEQTGFPSGMCTLSCSRSAKGTYVCPDTTVDTTNLFTNSRCIEAASGAARCVAECNFDKSPTGCRPGYACVLRARYQSPADIFPVCLPSSTQDWPAAPARANDIGKGCTAAKDCAEGACLNVAGGYCTKTMCEYAGCPSGSTCYSFSGSDTTACLKDCTSSSQCRASEGYVCDETSACWPSSSTPTWDSSSGASDCATAWKAGLSPCDKDPNHYVVVRKSARNMALCKKGALVANFNVGLGFAPTGDKEWQGDGKTPEGVFYIPQVLPNSSYYKAFLISYPDVVDAERGVAAGKISASQKSAIETAQASCKAPPQTTALGGYVEVHGHGGGQDWTWGCVAVENSEIDQMWSVLGVGDTIVILP